MMRKTIVTHKAPDLDAIVSVWLIKRFLVGWKEAEVAFVNAGQTWKGSKVDADPDILHVDTGLGRLDHHQEDDNICAAQLAWREIQEEHGKKFGKSTEAVERLLAVVNEVDHGRDISWPEADDDRYLFFLEEIFGGLKGRGFTDQEIIEFGLTALEGVYKVFKDRVEAEKILQEGKAIDFETSWGKGLAVETVNDTILTLGEKKGYVLVIKKDSRFGNVRIYARWDKEVDLTKVYEELKKKDEEADWFLHQSKKILLNGSASNPGMKPTKLSLQEIIDIIKNLNKF